MVYRRRRYRRTYRRVGIRRSRFPRRRVNRFRRRPRRYTQNTVYSFKKTVNVQSIVSGSTGTSRAYSFALSDVPGFATYTDLYDFYKIVGVKIMFVPRQTEQNNQIYLGMFHYVVDYNDSNAVDSAEEIMSRQGSRMRYMVGRPFSLYVKPRIAAMAYESGGSTGYYAERPRWMNTNDPTVPHYGLKVFLTQPSVGTTTDVYLTYWVRFKGVKAAADD